MGSQYGNNLIKRRVTKKVKKQKEVTNWIDQGNHIKSDLQRISYGLIENGLVNNFFWL